MISMGRWSWMPALLAVLAVSFAVRVFLLGSQSLWLDEGYTSYVAGMRLPAIFPELADNDIHPPLHYLALHGWTQLAGVSEFSLRFLSAAVGLLAIALTFKLGSLLRNRATGLLAALVLALSPLHVWYSQEARMYALVTLLSLLSMCLLARATIGAPAGSRRHGEVLWIAYAISTGLSLLTHFYAFLLLPVGLVVVLLVGRNLRTFARWVAAQAGALIIFSIWLPGAINQWGHDPHIYRVPFGIEQVIKNLGVTLTIGDQALPGAAVPIAVSLVLGALLVLGMLPLANREDQGRAGLTFAIVYLAGPVLLAYLLASGLGVNIKPTGGKYFIILLPPYALLLASGVSTLRRAGLPALLLGVVFVIGSSSFLLHNQYFQAAKEDFRSAVQYMGDRGWQGDAIILNAEHVFPPFLYYYRGGNEWYRASVSDAEGTGKWLEEVTRGHERVWLLLSHEGVSDPRGYVETWLNGHGLLMDERSFSGMRLAGYEMSYRISESSEIQHPQVSDFGDKLRLLGYSLFPAVQGEKALHVKLFWQSLSRTEDDLHVNLGLYDDDRRLWSQVDKAPIAEAYKTSRWGSGETLVDRYDLPIPPGTPPGKYALVARVYSPRGGHGLEVSKARGPMARDQLLMGAITLDGRQQAGVEEARRSVETPVMRNLGSALLVGGTLASKATNPGASLDLTLLWKASNGKGAGEQRFIELAGEDGSAWGRTKLDPGDSAVSRQASALLREITGLAIPKEIPGGRYSVRLGLEGRTETVSLGTVQVEGIQRSYTTPFVGNPQMAELGQRARLVGFDVSRTTLAPGEPLELILYWQAAAPMDEDYTVFAHVLNSRNQVLAQRDNMPSGGGRPTTTWLTGEVIEDTYEIQIPEGASPGQYAIEIGMYLASTGERLLAVSDSGQAGQEDRVLLNQELTVRPK